MSETPNLGLPYLEAAQAQKHVTVNEALRRLDALVQIAVLDRDLAAPPASPGPADTYIVGPAATGAWAGRSGEIAAFQDGAWAFLAPKAGWLAWIVDEARLVVRGASSWSSPTDMQNLSMLGILTAPDASNRLAVKADAALFSHDDVTPGSGDMRLTLNKKLPARDAGLVFQDGFSTRALLGLLADDQFTLKVSPDGAAFKIALGIDGASGGVALPQSPRFSAYTNFDPYCAANAWTKVPFNNADHNGQNAFLAASSRFIAPFAGTYRLAASTTFKANAAVPSSMHAAFHRNGVAVPRSARAVTALVSGKSHVSLDEEMALLAGDFVEVFTFMETSDGYVDQTRSSFRGHHVP
jgi:hypothetical protein